MYSAGIIGINQSERKRIMVRRGRGGSPQMIVRVCATLWGMVFRPILNETGFAVSLVTLKRGVIVAKIRLY